MFARSQPAPRPTSAARTTENRLSRMAARAWTTHWLTVLLRRAAAARMAEAAVLLLLHLAPEPNQLAVPFRRRPVVSQPLHRARVGAQVVPRFGLRERGSLALLQRRVDRRRFRARLGLQP